MNKTLNRSLCAAAAALSLALAAPVVRAEDSGFLADYSQLKTVADAKGYDRRIWVKDGADLKKYDQVIIDAVQLYPAPQPSERVSAGTLNDLRNYLEKAMRAAFGESLKIVEQPGPNVLRVRSAITAASVDTGLKPAQLIPIALLFTAAKRASGSASYDVKLQFEIEVIDATSGEVLARVVRQAQKVEVTGDQQLTLDVAKPQIDEWVSAGRDEIAARRRQ